MDAFLLTVPFPGVLTIESSSSINPRGQITDVAEPGILAQDSDSGQRSNFRLGHAVQRGTYCLEVRGERGSTGNYAVDITYGAGYFENPAADSYQSGVGVLSGWLCEADTVTIEFETADGIRVETASYGTRRLDTAAVCGHDESGFGFLWNWTNLGPGEHLVRAIADGIVIAEHPVTVTTLGRGEFPTGLSGSYVLDGFPTSEEMTRLVWQTAQQNFVIAPLEADEPLAAPGTAGDASVGLLENPQPGSFQSGVGVISGWVCEAEEVEIIFNPGTPLEETWQAGYPTVRTDTAGICGDTDNGFGLLFNWNRLGSGEHLVQALVDGEELGWSRVTVTTLGEEFRRGLRGRFTLPDFPGQEEAVTVEWQQGQQNFVITGREETAAP